VLRRAATSLAAAVVGSGAVLLAAPTAQAASAATITVPAVLNAGEATNVNGTCPATATKAAVTVRSGSTSLFAKSYAVVDGEWVGVVTVSGQMGNVTVSLACTAGGDTLATTTSTVLLFAVAEARQANVAVSPTSQPLGRTVTVSAACPVGSASAGVYLFQGDNDPFAGTAVVSARSTGLLTTSFPLALVPPPGSAAPAPRPGPATAVVFCNDAHGMPTGTGSRGFTITAALVSAPPPAHSGTKAPAQASRDQTRVDTDLALVVTGAASGAVVGTLTVGPPTAAASTV